MLGKSTYEAVEVWRILHTHVGRLNVPIKEYLDNPRRKGVPVVFIESLPTRITITPIGRGRDHVLVSPYWSGSPGNIFIVSPPGTATCLLSSYCLGQALPGKGFLAPFLENDIVPVCLWSPGGGGTAESGFYGTPSCMWCPVARGRENFWLQDLIQQTLLGICQQFTQLAPSSQTVHSVRCLAAPRGKKLNTGTTSEAYVKRKQTCPLASGGQQ